VQLIHVTDTHLAPIGTRYRSDDYPTAILSKLEQVVEAAVNLNVPIVHTGDMYDLQNPQRIPREFIDRVHQFILESGADWILLAGQHDYRGRDPSGARRSPINLLKYHKAVQSCVVGERMHLHRGILCINYHRGILDSLRNLTNYDKPIEVLAAHAMVVPAEVPWEHVTIDELAGLPVRVVLTGDYHAGYPVQTVGGTLFVNPGALARVDRNEAPRQPAYALVDTQAQTAEYIPVKAQPGAKVFDLQAAGEDKERMASRYEFASRLMDVDLGSEGITWEKLAVDLKEDEQVVERARRYYEAAEQ